MTNIFKDFFSKTFRGGIHIEDYKWITQNQSIQKAPIPKKVRVPLIQHAGKPALPVVKTGDFVKTGQLVGALQSGISSNIHSSITGKVTAIDKFPHPVCGESLCVQIEGDGIIDDVEKLTRDSDNVIQIIQDAGIVGMGGAMFPTHVKLMPPKDKKVDVIILNAAECEPFVTSDYRLMVEKPDVVLSGLEIIMKTVNAAKAFIGIESNKPEAIKIMINSINKSNLKNIEVIVLKTKYPQGGEKQLISAILNKAVPSGKLPFDVGVIVQNVATVVSVYEAVNLSKPLYERVVTVTGSCIGKPSNWLVRIGTMFSDVIELSGGLKNDAGKLIMGGPMMGLAQYTFDVPVIKGTNAIIVMAKNEVKNIRQDPCIRCGKCIVNCPMGLDPGRIATLIEKGKLDEAKESGALDCIECGVCAYTCPSNRNIIQLVKYAKTELAKRNKK